MPCTCQETHSTPLPLVTESEVQRIQKDPSLLSLSDCFQECQVPSARLSLGTGPIYCQCQSTHGKALPTPGLLDCGMG